MVEQAVNFTTISPDPGESVTSFYKKAGYGSLDEFVAAPINKGKIRFDKDNVPYVLAGVDYHVVQKEEPGIVPANNNISDEDLLIEKALEQKEQPVEDYSKGKFTGAGIDVSLEGEGDLDTAERDFTRGIVTEKRPGTYSVDITKGDTDVAISEAAQFAEGGKTEGGVTLEPTQKEVEVTPVITGDEVAAIPEGSPATTVSATNLDKVEPPGKDIPPPEDELLRLQALYKPLGTGKEIYDGVINKIKTTELPNTFDAKELYQQLAEDAERDTKKIDDQIAKIAKEEITPTFDGWNKFLAVLGAAMGAYGSAMTGTPNYALQIMNKAIDADQEQFLASKEIRTKTLLDQRQAVLQRRSDLLQLGINQADRMLSIAQQQQDNEIAVANMEAVKLGLENAAIEAHNEQITERIDVYTTRIAAKLVADTAKSKDERERRIEPVTLKDGKGDLIDMPEFLAKTKEEGAELRKTSGFGTQIQDVLNKLDALSDETNNLPKSALLPAVISETRNKVKALANELIIKLKDFYGMGANFTEYEQSLIQALTPTDAWLEKWGMWKVKSNNLRDTIVRTHRSMAAAQGAGFAQMPNAANKKKLGPGMKTGVSK